VEHTLIRPRHGALPRIGAATGGTPTRAHLLRKFEPRQHPRHDAALDLATPTFFDWDCLEGVVGYMKGRDWVAVGANRVLAGNPDTLDGYLKQHVPRQTANYIAVLLAQAGVLDLDDGRPARVRLSAEWSTT
jgi:hypothetical protein